MLKEALTYLVNLAKPVHQELNGRTFILDANGGYSPVSEPWPSALDVCTLTSLVDILHHNRDGLNLAELYIHVESPTEVHVHRKLAGPENQRPMVYKVEAELPSLALGKYMGLEEFRIMLLSCFQATEDLTGILSIAANFKEDTEGAITDNGITQRVVVKAGVSDVATVALKPMYPLRPYRTFQEVEQPESNFIFRLRTGGQAALFEADGGAWKYAARENVGNWLRGALQDALVSDEPGKSITVPVLV